MKLSLDSIGYGGSFTAPGESLPLEETFRRAAKFGYDAVCIYAHRPLGFPLDLQKRSPNESGSFQPRDGGKRFDTIQPGGT